MLFNFFLLFTQHEYSNVFVYIGAVQESSKLDFMI